MIRSRSLFLQLHAYQVIQIHVSKDLLYGDPATLAIILFEILINVILMNMKKMGDDAARMHVKILIGIMTPLFILTPISSLKLIAIKVVALGIVTTYLRFTMKERNAVSQVKITISSQ